MYIDELKLFQRSNEAIWTDEYISKSLLEAHLDDSNDGASRKPEKRVEIINWVNNSIKPSSKIIDLGCGPGLYSYELGKLGHYALGVDFNKASYDYANVNETIKSLVEYKYCNYLKDEIFGKFNIAIMIYCDFGALVPNEQVILLDKIKKITEDDGIFIFDIFGKSVIESEQEKRNWSISNGNDFFGKEPYLLMSEKKIFKNEYTRGERYYSIDQKNGKLRNSLCGINIMIMIQLEN
jgi:SAM-dependent methyltransferase